MSHTCLINRLLMSTNAFRNELYENERVNIKKKQAA